MKSIIDPAAYEAWYHTPRGQWIGDHEFSLMQHLLMAEEDTTLLDIGCGTGHFSRRFAQLGLSVTGIDPDPATLKFARTKGEDVRYMQGSVLELPFPFTPTMPKFRLLGLCHAQPAWLCHTISL